MCVVRPAVPLELQGALPRRKLFCVGVNCGLLEIVQQ